MARPNTRLLDIPRNWLIIEPMENSLNSTQAGRALARRPFAVSLSAVALLAGLLWSAPALAIFGDEESSGQPLVLGEIIVEGNTETDTGVILRAMGLQVGDPFSYEEMDRAWDTLEDIGYFAFVDMEYEEDPDGRVTLLVTVEEDMTTAYGPWVRYSRRHKYELGAWLEEQNLRGKGEILRLEAAFLYRQRARASWRRPWLFGQRGLEAEVALDWQQADFVFRPTRYRQHQAEASLRWRFYRSFFVAGGVNHGTDDYRDGYTWPAVDRGQDTPQPPVTHEPEKQTRTAFSAAVGWDSRSNPWYPRQGVLAEVRVRNWQSDQFASYTETGADLRLFLPAPVGKHILALRAEGRRVDGPAHLDNVLFYGGPETIRGHAFGRLEGDEGYLLTVEYRIPLFIMPISPRGEMVGLGLHVFGDAGDAWYEGADPGRALQSFGGGAHLNLDRLQLRFEAARTSEGDWRFEFMDTFNF